MPIRSDRFVQGFSEFIPVPLLQDLQLASCKMTLPSNVVVLEFPPPVEAFSLVVGCKSFNLRVLECLLSLLLFLFFLRGAL